MAHERATWEQIPAPVRADVERFLGSPVIRAANQDGGFSPGLAARVLCADGTRAFVKAAGTELNPDTPGLFRAERKVAAALPATVPAARLLHGYDDGDWVALVFEEIEGTTPQVPWHEPELIRVLRALEELAATGTPCPVPDMPSVAETLADDMKAYRRLLTDGAADLDPWELRHLPALAALTDKARAVLHGDSLVHLDARSDNMLLTGSGTVVFVDWAWSSTGPPWVDTLTLLINAAVDGLDPQEWAAGSPLLAAADEDDVTAVLAGLCGMWAEASRRPPPPGLPTVREFQRRYHAATLAWLRRRTGWS